MEVRLIAIILTMVGEVVLDDVCEFRIYNDNNSQYNSTKIIVEGDVVEFHFSRLVPSNTVVYLSSMLKFFSSIFLSKYIVLLLALIII